MENPKEETKREFVNNTSKWNIEDFEEPKQDYNGVHLRHCYQGEYEDCCKYGEDDCPAKLLNKPKQETLEEAKLNEKEFYEYMAKQDSWKSTGLIIQEFIQLKLKEQDKNKYSDEEVFKLLMEFSSRDINSSSGTPHNIAKWFEQFKKK